MDPCEASLSEEALTQREIAILHLNRGVVFYNLGEYEHAIEDFTAALDLDIHVKARVLVNRALCFEALKADNLARNDYQAALSYNPDNPTALRRLKELEKPIYERSKTPSRINAGAVDGHAAGL